MKWKVLIMLVMKSELNICCDVIYYLSAET